MEPLDPLDREILERALESAWAAKESGSVNLGSDEALELMLRTELAEIARSFGLNGSETLREAVLERLPRC